MDFLANMPGPEFLRLYGSLIFISFVVINVSSLVGNHLPVPLKKISLIVSFLVLNALSLFKLTMALSHGRHNVLFLILLTVVANIMLLSMWLVAASKKRRGHHKAHGRAVSRGSGSAYDDDDDRHRLSSGIYAGSWDSAAASYSSCNSSSSCSSSSSCNSSSCSSSSCSSSSSGCGGCGSSSSSD